MASWHIGREGPSGPFLVPEIVPLAFDSAITNFINVTMNLAITVYS
nr:MAG TPA: hypothetical protein [Caudoviricetes sp.]